MWCDVDMCSIGVFDALRACDHLSFCLVLRSHFLCLSFIVARFAFWFNGLHRMGSVLAATLINLAALCCCKAAAARQVLQ